MATFGNISPMNFHQKTNRASKIFGLRCSENNKIGRKFLGSALNAKHRKSDQESVGQSIMMIKRSYHLDVIFINQS